MWIIKLARDFPGIHPPPKVRMASLAIDWFMEWVDKLISLRNLLILVLELADCGSDKPSATFTL